MEKIEQEGRDPSVWSGLRDRAWCVCVCLHPTEDSFAATAKRGD